MKSICCNLELSKKLKEVGYKQDSLFYLEIRRNSITNKYDHYVIETKDNLTPSVYKHVASPTAEELLKELPNNCNIYKGKAYSVSYPVKRYKYIIEQDKKLCNALAKMYIYLAENKLLNKD